MQRYNFEKNYLRAHKNCEYCAAMGVIRQSEVATSRRIGEKEFFVALCFEHYQRLLEIESEG